LAPHAPSRLPPTVLSSPVLPAFLPKTFQNLSVSSPAPVTIVVPSGLQLRYRTRYVCPVRLTTCSIFGYFHTTIWFWLYPCVLTISSEFLLHARLHTWLPVSTSLIIAPVLVFQNLMLRSAVPPPEARRWCWCGDQATALTAAVCDEK